MRLDQEYYINLLAFALSSKDWTATAQAELFRNIILKNRSQTGQFLKLVTEGKEFRGYADTAITLKLGGVGTAYDAEGLGNDLDKVALYCPNVVEISCHRVDVRLEYFRNMNKLGKLNIIGGSVLPPSSPGAPIQTFNLPITLLSLHRVPIPSPIDPSSLPLGRSLHLRFQECPPIRPLLPHLDSLHIMSITCPDDDSSIQESTSVTSLSMRGTDIVRLVDASKTVIKERIVEFRIVVSCYENPNDSTSSAIIAGSKAMKKVILDGLGLSVANQVTPRFLETFKVVNTACKTKGIELWKENFEIGNGKVDLEK